MKYLSFLLVNCMFVTLLSAALNSSVALAQSTADDDSTTVSGMETSTCPDSFYGVSIPENGKLCQIFATDLPASMVFHVPQDVTSTVDYYQNAGNFSSAQESNTRFILQSIDNNTTVIVSPDGAGSQVDVLVKQAPNP